MKKQPKSYSYTIIALLVIIIGISSVTIFKTLQSTPETKVDQVFSVTRAQETAVIPLSISGSQDFYQLGQRESTAVQEVGQNLQSAVGAQEVSDYEAAQNTGQL